MSQSNNEQQQRIDAFVNKVMINARPTTSQTLIKTLLAALLIVVGFVAGDMLHKNRQSTLSASFLVDEQKLIDNWPPTQTQNNVHFQDLPEIVIIYEPNS